MAPGPTRCPRSSIRSALAWTRSKRGSRTSADTKAMLRSDCGPIRLTVRAGGLAESGAHPIVSATGVEIGEELCQRAIPATARTVGRCRSDHLPRFSRSEEHTSELQSRRDLVCRLLLEK